MFRRNRNRNKLYRLLPTLDGQPLDPIPAISLENACFQLCMLILKGKADTTAIIYRTDNSEPLREVHMTRIQLTAEGEPYDTD